MPTRQRLLREGLRLFATRGFAETTVGEIEAAAGLQPRRGALYRHFRSKEALLQAAVADSNASARDAAGEFSSLPVADPRALALLVGGWMLERLDDEEHISRMLEREGDRLADLRDGYRTGTDAGFAAASQVIAHYLHRHRPEADADAIGVELLGGLINFRRSAWTLGASPLGLDDERFLEGFADLFAMIVTNAPRDEARNPARPSGR